MSPGWWHGRWAGFGFGEDRLGLAEAGAGVYVELGSRVVCTGGTGLEQGMGTSAQQVGNRRQK